MPVECRIREVGRMMTGCQRWESVSGERSGNVAFVAGSGSGGFGCVVRPLSRGLIVTRLKIAPFLGVNW